MTDDVLNVQFGLRSKLTNNAYHTSTDSIPVSEIIPSAEPGLSAVIDAIAPMIAANPDLILLDSYPLSVRKQDWNALVNKIVINVATNTILPIDVRSKPGHKILDHHMTHFYETRNHAGKSVRYLAQQISEVKKALWANVRMHSTPYKSEIRRMLTMYGGMGPVTKYRAVTAKAIVIRYGAKRILDPCVGWGGRMLGSIAADSVTTYTGCEPDPRTFAALQNVVGDLPVEAQSRITLIHAPAETVISATGATGATGATITTIAEPYDMILTSPPFFNLELYGGPDQSTESHPTWDDWLTHWLKPLIIACLNRLTPTGTSCWNVKNLSAAQPLATEVKNIHTALGWKLVETVTMRGSARPGVGRVKDSKEHRGSEEETFCFKRIE